MRHLVTGKSGAALALVLGIITACGRGAAPGTVAAGGAWEEAGRRSAIPGDAGPGGHGALGRTHQRTEARRPGWLAGLPAEWPFRGEVPPVVSDKGMVASDAADATRAGIAILAKGGNAVDAAVATAFALAVAYPQAGNLGGGGFLVLRTEGGETGALDFRETAPAAARRDMFLGANGTPTDRSLTGHLAAGVPGSVAGLWEAHVKYGKLAWADLVAPAIDLAEEGVVVNRGFQDAIERNVERLEKFPASAFLFLPNGRPPEIGTRWRNPDLAQTLRRIAEQGPAGFYEGKTADLLVAEMRRGKGLITRRDLKDYRPQWRTPVSVPYHGTTLVSMPPPSSGGVVIALVARILEPSDLRALGWHSPAHLHLLVESFRRGFAARNRYLGDPDFVKVPLDQFLTEAAADRARATISATRATPSLELDPEAKPPAGGGLHTTHLSVVTADGGAAALTTTINMAYGSAVTVDGAGFVLNDEMDDFAVAPGTANAFGLVQGEANAVGPGKRMLSSMSPTIVVGANGKVLLVTGASGGPAIITATFQVISNVVDFGMDVRGAVAAPRVHHQHLPDVVRYERNGLLPAAVRALEALGHRLEIETWRLGDAPSILRAGQRWTGTDEPRQTGGLAAGE